LPAEQDSQVATKIEALVERLASDNPADREEANLKLRAQGVDAVASIRSRLESVQDSEIRARLKDIVKHILTKEGDSLFGTGDLDRALARYAEAEGASDIHTYIRERLNRIRVELGSWWPTNVHVESDYAALAKRVTRTYGPWGMSVLLQELGAPVGSSSIPAIHLMPEMGNEAVPFLIRAIGSTEPDLRTNACWVLHEMTARGRDIVVTDALMDALKALQSNEQIGRYTRDCAEKTHRMLQSVQKKQILRGEADRLFFAGELERALARYAEADGASNPQSYIKQRIEKARAELRSWFPSEVRQIHDYTALSKKVKRDLGPWGMAALLEELPLNEDMTPIHVIDLMEEMGKEATPFLTNAIKSSNGNLRANACVVLHRMTVRGKEMLITEALLDAAKSLSTEQGADKTTREYAATIYRMLSVYRKKSGEGPDKDRKEPPR
jgi:hypothetical protein